MYPNLTLRIYYYLFLLLFIIYTPNNKLIVELFIYFSYFDLENHELKALNIYRVGKLATKSSITSDNELI